MKIFNYALLALAILAHTAPAMAGDKPFVFFDKQIEQVPAATTLDMKEPTAAESVILSHGAAPTLPTNGDCWTATARYFCQINGAAAGPLAAQVPTKKSLGAIPNAVGAVLLTGYYATGDIAPTPYTSSGSACSLNSGAGDGGSQVPTSDGKCWVAHFSAGFVPVSQWGVLCNGTHDDTANIQAAFNYGGNLDFPTGKGNCNVTAGLFISNQISVRSGTSSAQIVTNQATGNVITINGPAASETAGQVTIDGLQFNTMVTRTSGAYIAVNGAYNVAINWCHFTNGYDHIRYTGSGGFGFYVENSTHYNASHVSILIDATAPPGFKMVLFNLNILGLAGFEPLAGIKVTSVGDLTLNRVDTVHSGTGLLVAPTAGNRVQLLKIIDSTFDSGLNWGIDVTPDGGPVNLIKIAHSWSATSARGGGIRFLATANGGTVQQADITDSVFSNNQLQGILIGASAANVQVNFSSMGSNHSDGIQMTANTQAFRLVGNTSGPSGEMSGNGGMGIDIMAGNSNGYIVTDNVLDNNAGANLIDGGTGTRKFVGNNI